MATAPPPRPGPSMIYYALGGIGTCESLERGISSIINSMGWGLKCLACSSYRGLTRKMRKLSSKKVMFAAAISAVFQGCDGVCSLFDDGAIKADRTQPWASPSLRQHVAFTS